jgi:hypothetical protein
MNEVRKELARLMLDGLAGRSIEGLWHQLRRRFAKDGHSLSWRTFEQWLAGETFPANGFRQDMLAEVVGGACGDAIRALPAPSFRGWRTRIMREKEMDRTTRMFPLVARPDEGGKVTKQAEIKCVGCGRTYHHLRRGEVDSDAYFKRKGWEVGNNAAHDFCPECVANRKVVKMSDHAKPPPGPVPVANGTANGTERVLGREDGRLLSRAIEDHWDDAVKRYRPGWSDVRVGEDQGVPIDWVKTIRERDFGGVGEDPGLEKFIAATVEIKAEMAELHSFADALASSVSAFETTHQEHSQRLSTMMEKYREGHNKLTAKVHKLTEVAGTLRPFDKAG